MGTSVEVLAVKFNHDPNSATGDAINLRKDAATFVTVPEWRRGVTMKPLQSPVAYAQKETYGHKITIKAAFGTGGVIGKPPKSPLHPIYPSKLKVSIRAITPKPFTAGVLGEVAERTVTPADFDADGFVTFTLAKPRLWTVGVGVYTVRWQWQYRTGPLGVWQELGTTTHRVFVLLEVPKSPWTQTPYNAANTQLPWSEVLDYACQWASGATTAAAAAGLVAQNIFALGPATVTYDCPGGGGSSYTDWGTMTFDCTAFLDRLGGGPGWGEYVNCTDCATFLATFANSLGCNLDEMILGYSFNLNEMIAIGSAAFGLPCGWWVSFSYHEVAWLGSCDNEGKVYDACLEVDGDADPSGGPPHTALLPVDMRYGAPGELGYRDRLVAPVSRPNCNPQCPPNPRRSVV